MAKSSVINEQCIQKEENNGVVMSKLSLGSLNIFRSTVEVMLADGILTREEKRLIIKLASSLNLTSAQPGEIYLAIKNERKSPKGDAVSAKEALDIYTKVFEVAIVNASLSRDEFRVLAHLRSIFDIDDREHALIENTLRDMVKEKFEDPNVMEKMLATLRDSVGLVGDIFDTVRKKTVDGGSS
jgi:hypothetical protein